MGGRIEALVADLAKLEGFAGRLAEGPAVTLEALAARDELSRRLGQVFVYAYVDYSVDTGDQAALRATGARWRVVRPGAGGRGFRGARVAGTRPGHAARVGGSEPRARRLPPLRRRSLPPTGATSARRGRGGAGPGRRALSGPTGNYSSLTDSELTFAAAPGAAGGEIADVTQGAVDTRCSAAPTASLRRSAWESYADGYLRRARTRWPTDYADGVKQDVFPPAFAATSRRWPHRSRAEHPARGLRQPDRDVRARTCRPGTATGGSRRGALGVERLHPYDIEAPLGRDSPELAYEQCGRVDLRGTRAARRRVRRRMSGAAASRSAGWTSIRTRARGAARSPRARPARDRSS